MISVSNVHKSFGEQVVLSGVNLTIESGSTVAIVGPSGTGKSVLLKLITGLLPADKGEIQIHTRSMSQAHSEKERNDIRRSMGVLFQAAALFDSLTLLENVMFPLKFRELMSDEESLERSLKRLEEVGLKGHEDALPGEVSIGMRKRVGLARALVTEPDILLFDEPNTGLDPKTGQEMYELIAETKARRKFTGIVISHELPEVFQICDRVIMLYNGIVQEDATVSDFLKSDKEIVRQFMNGDVNGPISMM